MSEPVHERDLLSPDALEKNAPAAPRAVPPLAGFWFRLGALLIDIFILRLALQLSVNLFRPLYLSLGGASVLVGLLVAYLYLVLAEARFGEGKTVGKAILQIRTTGMEGEPPSGQAVAIRSAVLLVLALMSLSNNVTEYLVVNGKPPGMLLVPAAMGAVCLAFVVANVFLVVLHPLKQGVADLAAKTLVVRDAGAHNLATYLERAAEQGQVQTRRAIQFAAIAFVGLGAFFIYQAYPMFSSDKGRQQVERMQSFQEEFNYGPFTARLPTPGFASWAMAEVPEDVPTGDSATSPPATGNSATSPPATGDETGEDATSPTHVLVVNFWTHRPVTAEDYGTTGELTALESRVAQWAARCIQENRPPLELSTRKKLQKSPGEETAPLAFQPRYVKLTFDQDIDLLVYRATTRLRTEYEKIPLPSGFYEKEREILRTEAGESASDEKTGGAATDDESTTAGTQ